MNMTIRQTREFAREQRIATIMRMHREGQPMSAIGRAFDLTKARIQQIIRDVERSEHRHVPKGAFGDLPPSVQNALKDWGIETVHELAAHTLRDIKLLPGVGQSGLAKLEGILRENGLQWRSD